jgi:hypothetical protein
MSFPHVLRRDNTWGTPPKVHKSTKKRKEKHEASIAEEKEPTKKTK